MKISKTLTSCLIISCMSVVVTSCNSSSSQVARNSEYAEANTTKSPIPQPVKVPEVYDVICFKAVGLMVDHTMCSPDQTYKVLRNTKITVYLKKETSVQQGTNTVVSFNYKDKNNGQLQKTTVPEMESLASQGANIYTMHYRMAENNMFGSTPDNAEVEIFNSKLGKFEIFARNSTQIVFATGDTKIRYKHKANDLEKFSQRTGLR
jgi:hypothetical protein